MVALWKFVVNILLHCKVRIIMTLLDPFLLIMKCVWKSNPKLNFATNFLFAVVIHLHLLLEVGDPALEESHTRGLPSDHTGKVWIWENVYDMHESVSELYSSITATWWWGRYLVLIITVTTSIITTCIIIATVISSHQVRLVTIPGVDANLCCGTHVGNTSQLQVNYSGEALHQPPSYYHRRHCVAPRW